MRKRPKITIGLIQVSTLSIISVVFSPSVIAEADPRSIVYIECYDKARKNIISSGSGTVVTSSGLILTAGHVIPADSRCFAAIGGGKIPDLALVQGKRHSQYDAIVLQMVNSESVKSSARY